MKAPGALLAPSFNTRGTNKPTGGLLGAPGGWLFGGSKQQQQNLARSAAFGRLANVDMTAARAPPAQPLRIVVAGFSAEEAASELLPHFLDFAPAKRCVADSGHLTKPNAPTCVCLMLTWHGVPVEESRVQ